MKVGQSGEVWQEPEEKGKELTLLVESRVSRLGNVLSSNGCDLELSDDSQLHVFRADNDVLINQGDGLCFDLPRF